MKGRLTGTLIAGRYRVDDLVALGGSSEVYAAQHLQLGVRVALKVRRRGDAEAALDAQREREFLREGAVLLALRHPNIVNVLDSGVLDSELGGVPYLVLSWCEGVRLSTLIADPQRRPMTPAQAWAALQPIVDAVAHAHERGIVHGDLTPTRILVAPSSDLRNPKLFDLGCARQVVVPEGEAARDHAELAALQQVERDETSFAADVHALGLLFLALLPTASPGNAMDAHAPFDPTPERPRLLEVDAGPFDTVIARALATEPSVRFHSARAFQRAMRVASEASKDGTLRGVADDTAAAPKRTGASTSRRGWLLASGAFVASLAAAAAWRATRPAPGAGSAGPAEADPLSALDSTIIEARVKSLGLRVASASQSDDIVTVSALTPGKVLVSIVLLPAPACPSERAAACEPAVRDAIIRDHRLTGGDVVAYASSSKRVLVVRSESAGEAEQARDAIIEGLSVGQKGIVRAGERPSDQGRRATTVAALGPGELTTQLEDAGFQVTWAGRSGDAVRAMAMFKDATKASAASVYSTAYVYEGDVSAIVASIDGQQEPYAWAQAGSYVIVLRGDASLSNRDTLASVIRGLDATIGGSRP